MRKPSNENYPIVKNTSCAAIALPLVTLLITFLTQANTVYGQNFPRVFQRDYSLKHPLPGKIRSIEIDSGYRGAWYKFEFDEQGRLAKSIFYRPEIDSTYKEEEQFLYGQPSDTFLCIRTSLQYKEINGYGFIKYRQTSSGDLQKVELRSCGNLDCESVDGFTTTNYYYTEDSLVKRVHWARDGMGDTSRQESDYHHLIDAFIFFRYDETRNSLLIPIHEDTCISLMGKGSKIGRTVALRGTCFLSLPLFTNRNKGTANEAAYFIEKCGLKDSCQLYQATYSYRNGQLSGIDIRYLFVPDSPMFGSLEPELKAQMRAEFNKAYSENTNLDKLFGNRKRIYYIQYK